MNMNRLISLLRDRKSLPVIILTLFWVGYSGLNLYEYYYMTQSVFDQENNARLMRIEFHIENSVSYLVNEQVEPLMEVLDKARQMKQFDFFLLKKNGELLSFGNQSRSLASIDQNYTDYAELLDDGKALFKTIKVTDYTLTVGSHKALVPRFFNQLDSRKWVLLADVFGVGLLVLLIAMYSLKDIRKLSFALETGDRGNLQGIQTLSREGQALLSSARGLHESESQIKASHEVISRSLGPAILEEIKQNKKAPYSFQATLVRIDLNGYTQLFLEKNADYISLVLNTYFQKAQDMIERYHGKVYQIIGDEIVFIIKDSEEYHSQLMALSAVRSLFQEADVIEQTLASKEGHNFKLKASFSHGEMRFIKLDEGFAFSGLPLIESVRMLGAVKEKSENTLIFFSHDLPVLQNYCEPKEEVSMTFKGFLQETKLIQVQKMLSIQEALANEKTSAETAYYFRGNIELQQLFTQLTHLIQENHADTANKYLKNMRHQKVKISTPEVKAAYKNLLQNSLAFANKNEKLDQAVASIVSLTTQFVQIESFDQELKSILTQALTIENTRIRANALEVLGHYLPDQDIYQEFLQASPNRVLANALLIEGKRKMKRYIRNRLEEMMTSQDQYLIASAVWVIGELVDHYHNKDLATYLSNPDLQSLMKKSMTLVNHEDKMVQARAKLTCEKIQSYKLAV